MGIYVNKGNTAFQRALRSEYVDKSGLIGVVNNLLFTGQQFSCVTRCRRFGKSMAAMMLAAYYDCSCDSRALFANLEIAGDPSFEEHLNKYPVIYLDVTDFISRYHGDQDIVVKMQQEVMEDIHEAYPDVPMQEGDDLMRLLQRIQAATGQPFFFIIDEWDAICREFKPGTKGMEDYVSWLRRMFKSVTAYDVFAGVYMTGILPIRKFRTQSALNNFQEYSMLSPGDMASYFGFTREEVMALAGKHGMDFAELEKWYDGYQIGRQPSMFNPNSVMQALRRKSCESFWGMTGAFDAISDYINMNYEGLKDDVIRMLTGERCDVDITGFTNDLYEIRSRDDVLTVLCHLGYLTYDVREHECYIPNLEVSGEMSQAVKTNGWTNVADALRQSKALLRATLDGDEQAVARAIDAAHSEQTSILSYNNENSMACVLSIAYYYAHGDYIIHRELATGKGFADLVFIPRKNVSSPAMVVELKFAHAVETAIDQIRQKRYQEKLQQYTGDVLLVGVSYDRETKTHNCRIERY